MLINYLDEKIQKSCAEQPEVHSEILPGHLRDSSNRICQFSTDFLTWYNSQKLGFIIKSEPIELDGFVKDTCAFYSDMARRKGLSIEYTIPPGLTFFSDRNILSIIIRNLVDNAIKYTLSGSIRITAERADEHIHIRISDTGPGMTARKIEEILAYTEEGADKATVTFGYRFITELVRKLGGTLNIVSDPGKGTSVTITLRA